MASPKDSYIKKLNIESQMEKFKKSVKNGFLKNGLEEERHFKNSHHSIPSG